MLQRLRHHSLIQRSICDPSDGRHNTGDVVSELICRQRIQHARFLSTTTNRCDPCVRSNTSIQSVKQRLSSDGQSTSLKHCRPDRRLSIFPRKKREINSHPWAAKWNSGGCCTRWPSSDLSRGTMFLLLL